MAHCPEIPCRPATPIGHQVTMDQPLQDGTITSSEKWNDLPATAIRVVDR
jgi:hypothetical protein